MSRPKRARYFQSDNGEARRDVAAVDPFSPALLIERLRAACSGVVGDAAFLRALVQGAYIAATDPTALCATLTAIYEPLWRGLTPIHARFPVLYALLGRPPTPASIVQAIPALAPDLAVDATNDPVAAVWRVAAETDARRWAGVPTDEWRYRAGPGAFEGAYEERVASARYETRQPTMADLMRSVSPNVDDASRQTRYYLAATRNARGDYPVAALLLADGAVLASLLCRRPPAWKREVECAGNIARFADALPADTTPYMRDLLNDDRALDALLAEAAAHVVIDDLIHLNARGPQDLWDISPVVRPALLNASRPGARWLVDELDEHQLTARLETERNIERVGSRLGPLARATPTLAMRSARALARGPASTALLRDMTAPDEVKALVAAQRVAQRCGRSLVPEDMPYLVDAADALGLDGDLTLQLLGPYDLCREAADAAARILERHHAMAAAE